MLNYLFYGLLLWIPISNFGSVTVANDEVNVIEKNTFQTHKKEGATQTQKSEERRHYNSSAVTKTRSEKPKMRWGTFALVFLSGVVGVGFLGFLGILIALGVVGVVHASTKDKAKRKSAWWGFGVFAVLFLIFAIAATFSALAGGL
jgi:hypothetical protein